MEMISSPCNIQQKRIKFHKITHFFLSILKAKQEPLPADTYP